MPTQNESSTMSLSLSKPLANSPLKNLGANQNSMLVWLNLVTNWIYIAAFFSIYKNYLSIEWSYVHFHYRIMSFSEWSFILVSVSIASIFLPRRISSPSSMILWFLHSFILVPANIITFMIGGNDPLFYVPSLISMTLIMSLAGYLSNKRSMAAHTIDKNPDNNFIIGFLILFILSSYMLYYYFEDIIAFSSIEDVYYQRFAAAELGGGVIGYIRTHYAFVFAPVLIAIGLCNKGYRYLIVLGIMGCILVYMIDASKISLILPLVMIIFYFLMKFGLDSTYILTSGLTALTIIGSFLTTQFSLIKLMVDLLVLRSIAIPAQTFVLYADLFNSRDYTWWSNVRGINLFVSPPDAFTAHPSWPVLGQIVGAEYYGYGSRVNSNANFFVGEGVAAGGFIGVLVVGIIFLMFLDALDRSTKGWNRTFIVVATIPMGFSLTNTHLSTLLLSFGGLFWLLLFRYYKPT